MLPTGIGFDLEHLPTMPIGLSSSGVRLFLRCLLATAALLALSWLVFRPSYATNDDVFMTMIASGIGFCPAPDEHLVFTNVLIGQVLSSLYTALPNVPWYGGYLLLIHWIAQTAILYCALTIGDPKTVSLRQRVALYLIYFVLVELTLLNNMQFTTTAFLAAQAGLFLLAKAVWPGGQPNRSLPTLCAGALLVVAGLVRLEGLAMALMVAAPLGLWLAWRSSWRAMAPAAVAACAAGLMLLAASVYDRNCYEDDPAWRGFARFNALRVKFNDYKWTSYTPRTAELFDSVGWSEADHAMIANWYYDDAELYSEQRLRQVVDGHSWKSDRLGLSFVWQASRGWLQDRSIVAVWLSLPIFLGLMRSDRSARRAVWISVGWSLALIVLLSWNTKILPARTYFPMLSFPLAVGMLFSVAGAMAPVTENGKEPGNTTRVFAQPRLRLALVLLAIGLGMGVVRQASRSIKVNRERQSLISFLADWPDGGHRICVCWEAAMPYELISPLDNLAAWRDIPILNLTWTQRTMWQDEIKRRAGIDDLARALYVREDLLLVCTARHRQVFADFARQHFGAEVEFTPLVEHSEKFVAGHFRAKDSQGRTAVEPGEAVQR